MSRCFYLIDTQPPGKYFGKYPLKAASKAFSQLARELTVNEKCIINFSLREYGKNKDYDYRGERIKLDKPIVKVDKEGKAILDKNGNKITYKFLNKIRRIKSKTLKKNNDECDTESESDEDISIENC